MKHGFIVLVLSLVTSVCFAKAPLFSFGANSPHLTSLPTNFKIVDWNIYKGYRSEMPHDFANLSKNADLALFQETYETPALIPAIANANPELSWKMVEAFRYRGYNTGVSIGSRVEAIRVEGFRTDVHEPILFSPKSMILAVYPLANTNENLTVLNVHGINFVSTSTFDKQVQQILSILKDIKGPMLVAGDFNTWKNERLVHLDAALKTLNLHRLTLANNGKNDIDHAYVRGLEATEATLVQEVNSSDHKPMILQLQLKAGGEPAEQLQAKNP